MTRGRKLELAWSEHQGRSCIRVRGWTTDELHRLAEIGASEFARRLAVLPSELIEAGADLSAIQPIAGRFEFAHNAICFLPRFPFLDGTRYSLVLDPAAWERGEDRLEVWTIQRPAPEETPTTGVLAIYPTTDELPVNQLKLYIHFSGPMSEDWAARAVSVRREDNDELLDGVFLEMEPELWDRERRRLTLLLDPGRIKRGLVPNQESGYPLIEGVPIVVSVNVNFRDAAGRRLRSGKERRYEIGPPLRVRVNPADWRRHWPAAGSTNPITIEFDRPLDHALLEHSLWVTDASGVALPGKVSIGPADRSWRFEPESPWAEERHLVKVDSRLEDLAGNSLIRVFDRDLLRAEDAPVDAIDFTCAPSRPGEA